MVKLLANQKIVVARALHQAGSLKTLLEACGAQVIVFPAIKIEPIHPNINKVTLHLMVKKADFLIFVSPNAVENGIAFCHSRSLQSQCVAVGPSTAQKMRERGLSVHVMPSSFNSEGILQALVQQPLLGKQVIIFSGENSRPFLKHQLENLGAVVNYISCYRRVCPQVSPEACELLQSQSINWIICTSKAVLRNFYHMFYDQQDWLLSIPLLVISQGMVELAKEIGFQLVRKADNATDEAIQAALIPHENLIKNE